MSETIDEKVEAYLNGELSQEQSEAFERDLAQPEVARIFGQALMIREMLQKAPPDDLPDGLLARIEQDVLAELENTPEDLSAEAKSGAKAALAALAWSIRGPSMALSGLSTTRYVLGPLAQGKRTEKKPTKSRRSLRLLKRLLRRRK